MLIFFCCLFFTTRFVITRTILSRLQGLCPLLGNTLGQIPTKSSRPARSFGLSVDHLKDTQFSPKPLFPTHQQVTHWSDSLHPKLLADAISPRDPSPYPLAAAHYYEFVGHSSNSLTSSRDALNRSRGIGNSKLLSTRFGLGRSTPYDPASGRGFKNQLLCFGYFLAYLHSKPAQSRGYRQINFFKQLKSLSMLRFMLQLQLVLLFYKSNRSRGHATLAATINSYKHLKEKHVFGEKKNSCTKNFGANVRCKINPTEDLARANCSMPVLLNYYRWSGLGQPFCASHSKNYLQAPGAANY